MEGIVAGRARQLFPGARPWPRSSRGVSPRAAFCADNLAIFETLRSETIYASPRAICRIAEARLILRETVHRRGHHRRAPPPTAAETRSPLPARADNGMSLSHWRIPLPRCSSSPSEGSPGRDRSIRAPTLLRSVKIRLPARDTVLRTASGSVQLSADLFDDIGLVPRSSSTSSAPAPRRLSRSSRAPSRRDSRGEQERAARSPSRLPFFQARGRRDRLSVRAVAADREFSSGPERPGFSETDDPYRLRKDEYDSALRRSGRALRRHGDAFSAMLIIETEKPRRSDRSSTTTRFVASPVARLARQTDQAPQCFHYFDEGGDAPEITMDTESIERSVQVTSSAALLNDPRDASRRLDVADLAHRFMADARVRRCSRAFRSFVSVLSSRRDAPRHRRHPARSLSPED